MDVPASISPSRYMKTPRELTSRVCPAISSGPFARNLTEIGKTNENRRVERFSGCGCAIAGLQVCPGTCWEDFSPIARIFHAYSDKSGKPLTADERGKRGSEWNVLFREHLRANPWLWVLRKIRLRL